MYTLSVLLAVAAVLVAEVAWLRTGLLKRRTYWATLGIVWAFQVPVDGWLTKLSAPIVIYNPSAITGLRFPWDIPIEDFAYSFALVTLALLLWVRAGRGEARRAGSRPGATP